jgi:hypothetical protein
VDLLGPCHNDIIRLVDADVMNIAVHAKGCVTKVEHGGGKANLAEVYKGLGAPYTCGQP